MRFVVYAKYAETWQDTYLEARQLSDMRFSFSNRIKIPRKLVYELVYPNEIHYLLEKL